MILLKKLFALSSLILIISLIFSSCSKKAALREFSPEKSFSLHMKAEKDGKNFEADITCLNSEDIKIAFTFPGELSGFSVTTEKDGYAVNIFGLTDELTSAEINNASLLNILTKALKTSVFTNHGLFTADENGYNANLTIDSIPVSVSFSPDGFLQKITCETLNFSAQFEIDR